MTRAYEAAPVLKLKAVDDQGKANYPSLVLTVPGRAVFELQEDLHALGFLPPKPDGAFGENTYRAVRAFQKANGLAVDGEAGENTKKALAARAAGAQAPAAPSNDGLYAYLKATIENLGHLFESKPLRLNLLGIRGFWHSQKVANDFNRYNDTIYALWLDSAGKQMTQVFDASCDPGKLGAAQQNAGGTAHLMEGQWFFQRGLHASSYRALRQARPVRVKRYFDDDPDRVKPAFDEGYFGINIHAAGSAAFVNNWSAGCQVLWGGLDGAPWKAFDRLVYETCAQDQAQIPYTLVRSDALPDWPA